MKARMLETDRAGSAERANRNTRRRPHRARCRQRGCAGSDEAAGSSCRGTAGAAAPRFANNSLARDMPDTRPDARDAEWLRVYGALRRSYQEG